MAKEQSLKGHSAEEAAVGRPSNPGEAARKGRRPAPAVRQRAAEQGKGTGEGRRGKVCRRVFRLARQGAQVGGHAVEHVAGQLRGVVNVLPRAVGSFPAIAFRLLLRLSRLAVVCG